MVRISITKIILLSFFLLPLFSSNALAECVGRASCTGIEIDRRYEPVNYCESFSGCRVGVFGIGPTCMGTARFFCSSLSYDACNSVPSCEWRRTDYSSCTHRGTRYDHGETWRTIKECDFSGRRIFVNTCNDGSIDVQIHDDGCENQRCSGAGSFAFSGSPCCSGLTELPGGCCKDPNRPTSCI